MGRNVRGVSAKHRVCGRARAAAAAVKGRGFCSLAPTRVRRGSGPARRYPGRAQVTRGGRDVPPPADPAVPGCGFVVRALGAARRPPAACPPRPTPTPTSQSLAFCRASSLAARLAVSARRGHTGVKRERERRCGLVRVGQLPCWTVMLRHCAGLCRREHPGRCGPCDEI